MNLTSSWGRDSRRPRTSAVELASIAAPTAPLAVFSLAGDQGAMGLQHAAMLRSLGGWRETLEYYPEMVERVIAGAHDGVDVLGPALRPVVRRLLTRMHRRRPAEGRARTEAFYRGLGLNPSDARAVAIMDVLQNCIGVAGRAGLGGVSKRALLSAPPACSTLVAWDDASAERRLIHGRNFDFPGTGVWELQPTVVFCAPAEGVPYGFVSTRGADVPAVSVFNAEGLCLTTHTRFHQDVDFSGALVIDLIHDVVRSCVTLQQAVAKLRHTHVASTWGVVVSSAKERRAALVELTARGADVTYPGEGQSWLACTNRYRSARLQRGELQPSPGFMMHSDGRFAVLQRHAQRAQAGAGLTIEGMQALLGSHEDADCPEVTRAAGGVLAQANGVHSVVMDPERQVVSVAVGGAPASHGPWIDIPWRWDEGISARELDLTALRREHSDDSHRYRAGATGLAYRRFLAAAQQEMLGGSAAKASQALEESCALDPSEPTYRLLAGGYRLRDGDLAGAYAHFEQALVHERSPFYRARLLLWASRCALDARQACRHRDALMGLQHPQIAHYQRQASAERERPLPARALRGTKVQLQLCDLNL